MCPRTTINRRTFLALTGGGATATLLGGTAALALRPGALRQPRRALQVLDATSFSVLAAVADQLCPGGEGLPTAWELEVPEDVDLFLSTAHPQVAEDLMLGLGVLESAVAGLLLEGRTLPFTRASKPDQWMALKSLATSRLGVRKTLYKGLLALVAATYWGNPRTFTTVGYRPLDFSGWTPADP